MAEVLNRIQLSARFKKDFRKAVSHREYVDDDFEQLIDDLVQNERLSACIAWAATPPCSCRSEERCGAEYDGRNRKGPSTSKSPTPPAHLVLGTGRGRVGVMLTRRNWLGRLLRPGA